MVRVVAVQRLIIVGAGGHGRETLDVVEAANAAAARDGAADGSPWEFLGFVADVADEELLARRGARWLGPVEGLAARLRDAGAGYHLAIGDGAVRRELGEDLRSAGLGACTLVHPAASVGADVRIGDGTLLAAGARVTTNVELGRHVQCNVNAVVSHDCVIGDHVTLSPGVLVNGDVAIGEGTFLGTGAIVLPGCRIGARAVIGAGAVVTGDVVAGATAVGVPARPR